MVRAERGAHPAADQLVLAARALVGVRFRPQGRNEGGLDCVGLLWLAALRAGIRLGDRRDYPLRPNSADRVVAMLCREGFLDLPTPAAGPGDLLVMEPARDQVHLCLLTDRGVIEAHAGLRRMVERPHRADECIIGAYRFPEGED